MVTGPAADGLRISTSAGFRDAVKIRKEGIDNRNVGGSAQLNSAAGLFLRGAVHPQAVEYDVVCGAVRHDGSQTVNHRSAIPARYFKPEQAIVIGPRGKLDRPGSSLGFHHQFGHHIGRGNAVKIRPPRQRRDASIAGSDSRAFLRQRGIRGTGADYDPVIVVTSLSWKTEKSHIG